MHGSGAFCDIERCVFSILGYFGRNVLTVKPARKRSGGVIRSENVDMSSDKQGERPCRRKSQGKPTPKARPKGVVDGNQFNITGPGDGDGSKA